MGGDSRAGSRQRPGLELKLTSASCLLQIIDEADRMIDSMHQSWLPRVVAAAFPSEGPRDPCAVLQRTQPRVVTAARYLALSFRKNRRLHTQLDKWPVTSRTTREARGVPSSRKDEA